MNVKAVGDKRSMGGAAAQLSRGFSVRLRHRHNYNFIE